MSGIVGLLLPLLLVAASFAGPAGAQEPNRAGLIIQFDDERVETWCLAFEGDKIAGNDLLARSGLDMVIDASSGMGITVCQIEGQGCAFPAEHCFCQCMGGEGCRYWNYFYREPGDTEWTYSPLGALLRQVQPGAVEAWVWGDGQARPDDALTFEVICSAPTPTAAPPSPTKPPATPAATEVASPTLSPAAGTPSAMQPPAATATATAAPTAAPPSPTSRPPASPTPASPGPAGGTSGYLYFGLMALGLLLIGVVVWLRRR